MAGLDPATHAVRHSDRELEGSDTVSTLAITSNGMYTLTASDGSLPTAVSNPFQIGASAFDNFNSAATSFTTPFATNNSGVAGGTGGVWGIVLA